MSCRRPLRAARGSTWRQRSWASTATRCQWTCGQWAALRSSCSAAASPSARRTTRCDSSCFLPASTSEHVTFYAGSQHGAECIALAGSEHISLAASACTVVCVRGGVVLVAALRGARSEESSWLCVTTSLAGRLHLVAGGAERHSQSRTNESNFHRGISCHQPRVLTTLRGGCRTTWEDCEAPSFPVGVFRCTWVVSQSGVRGPVGVCRLGAVCVCVCVCVCAFPELC